MKAVTPHNANSVFVAKDCDDLPVHVRHDPTFGKIIESVWELDGDELMAVLESKKIRLHVVGGQPPVFLEVEREP